MKKTPVTMDYEDGVMTVEDWYDGKVLWRVKTDGAIMDQGQRELGRRRPAPV